MPELSGKSLPEFDLDFPLIGDGRDALTEVSPPDLIQSLKLTMSEVEPRLEILKPEEDETLTNDETTVKLSVSGLKLFQDPDLGLGPHIALFVDDDDPIEVFDLNQPIQLKGLKPGTHIIRAIAAYPWHESFKNTSAYDQVSFHVFTRSQSNSAGKAPLLTTSSIQNVYTAEPMLLDFAVRGAERELSANPPVNVEVTFNDQSFTVDAADGSLYLAGLQPGHNWLKLELEDAKGRLSSAPFSEQLFSFEFQPETSTPLGELLSEKLSFEAAGGIVGIPKPKQTLPKSPTQATTSTAPSMPSGTSGVMSQPEASSGASAGTQTTTTPSLSKPFTASPSAPTSPSKESSSLSSDGLDPSPRTAPPSAKSMVPSNNTEPRKKSEPVRQDRMPLGSSGNVTVSSPVSPKPLNSSPKSTVSPHEPTDRTGAKSHTEAVSQQTSQPEQPGTVRPGDKATPMRSLGETPKKQLAQRVNSWRDRLTPSKDLNLPPGNASETNHPSLDSNAPAKPSTKANMTDSSSTEAKSLKKDSAS